MSIATELENYRQGLTEAYGMVEEKGGTLPEKKNLANLSDSISSISGGGESGEQMPTFDEYYPKNRPAEWPVLPDPENNEAYALIDTNLSKGDIRINSSITAYYSLSYITKVYVYAMRNNEMVLIREFDRTADRNTLTLTKDEIANDRFLIIKIARPSDAGYLNMDGTALCQEMVELKAKVEGLTYSSSNKTSAKTNLRFASVHIVGDIDRQVRADSLFESSNRLEAAELIDDRTISVTFGAPSIFRQCHSLKAFPKLSWDRLNAINHMFYGSGIYGDIEITVDNCTYYANAFSYCRIKSLTIHSKTNITAANMSDLCYYSYLDKVVLDMPNLGGTNGTLVEYCRVGEIEITQKSGGVWRGLARGGLSQSIGKVVFNSPFSLAGGQTFIQSVDYLEKLEFKQGIVTLGSSSSTLLLRSTVASPDTISDVVKAIPYVTAIGRPFNEVILASGGVLDFRGPSVWSSTLANLASGALGIGSSRAGTYATLIFNPFSLSDGYVNKALIVPPTASVGLSIYVDSETEKWELGTSATTVFSTQTNIVVYVADSLYDTYMADSNWSSLGARLKKHSEYVGPGIPPRA